MFDTLSNDEKQLLVRFPYRLGLYVSEADTDGGAEAQERERRVLSSIIAGFTADVMGAESIQHVISETVALQDEWDEWGADLENVPAECSRVISVVSEHISKKDARAFSVQMYEIADAVALAFKEYEEGGLIEQFKLYLRYKADQKTARANDMRQRSFGEYKSISDNERIALQAVARGLGLVG